MHLCGSKEDLAPGECVERGDNGARVYVSIHVHTQLFPSI
jgi:hypothetical protein